MDNPKPPRTNLRTADRKPNSSKAGIVCKSLSTNISKEMKSLLKPRLKGRQSGCSHLMLLLAP